MLEHVPPAERFSRERQLPLEIKTPEAFDAAVESAVLKGLLPPAPFIDRNTNLVTIGSCFAHNISTNLAAAGYKVCHVPVLERLFNAFALRTFVKALAPGGDLSDFERHWQVDLATVAGVREALTEGAAVVITYGLSVVWFDKQTNSIVFDPSRKKDMRLFFDEPDRFEMRTTSVYENSNAMVETINALRSINPRTKIILTLSPVHLARAVMDYPGVVADSISKSTLRCALHEITSMRLADIYYYPSFEILRWLASMVDKIWGADDMLHHIQARWIAYTLGKFKQHYCGETPVPPPLGSG